MKLASGVVSGRSSEKAKTKKLARIERLLEEIRLFNMGDLVGLHFMCPTCLQNRQVPEDLSGVDFAHIVPESAGGKWATLTCKGCNSHFGSHQDRWLSDFLVSRENIVDVFKKENHFFVDGVKFNGRVIEEPNGDITWLIERNRNPPNTKAVIEEMFRVRRPNLSLQIPFPVDNQKNAVFVGLLTAGYLAWLTCLDIRGHCRIIWIL